MSINLEFKNLVERYVSIFENKSRPKNLTEIEKRIKSLFSSGIKRGDIKEKIKEIRRLINEIEIKVLTRDDRHDGRELRNIKKSINDLVDNLLATNQETQVPRRGRKRKVAEEITPETIVLEPATFIEEEPSKVFDIKSLSTTELEPISELYNIVNQYITLIDGRELGDEDIKEIDRSTKNFLMMVVKEKSQNENIQEAQQRIEATPKDGIDGDKLEELKTRINNLTNQLQGCKRKALEEVVLETQPTNRIDATFEALLPYMSTGMEEYLIQDVVQYDQNQCNDIIDILQQGKEISEALKIIARSVTVLDLDSYPGEITDLPKILEFFKNVTELTLPRSTTTDADLASLATLTSLKTLDLRNCSKITDTGLASLATLTSLQTLDLSEHWKITDTGLASLATLTSLQTLNLKACWYITDTGLASLATLTSLKTLNLEGCYSITDIGLASLATLTSLKTLNLNCCDNITDTGLASLATLTSLKTLNLENCSKITDTGLASLAMLTSLQTLDLRNCSKITDTGLDSLATLRSLQTLGLERCSKITDTGLDSLATLTSLQTLNLTFCDNITDTGLDSLATLTSLQTLDLSYCRNITDTGLSSLATLTSLQTLNLDGCDNITDTGLASLTTLTSLQTLYLRNCSEITDTGLASLATLTSLKTLNLSYSRNITNTQVCFMKNRLISVYR